MMKVYNGKKSDFIGEVRKGILFLMVFIYIYLYYFLTMPHSLWDLSSPSRDRTWALSSERWSPNHWTTRDFPRKAFLRK